MDWVKEQVDCKDHNGMRDWIQYVQEVRPLMGPEQLITGVSHDRLDWNVSHLVVNQHG